MIETRAGAPGDMQVKAARLRQQLDRLRTENERLRRENRALREALDAYIARAGSTSLYGPHEMTAGTSTGPRRR